MWHSPPDPPDCHVASPRPSGDSQQPICNNDRKVPMQRFIPKLLAIGLLTAASARAGSAFYDFNSDQPDPTTVLNFGGTLWDGISHTGTGSANWQTNGGAGPVGSTTNGPVKPGVNGDGFLQLTFATLNC